MRVDAEPIQATAEFMGGNDLAIVRKRIYVVGDRLLNRLSLLNYWKVSAPDISILRGKNVKPMSLAQP